MNWKEINEVYVRPAVGAWKGGRTREAEEIFEDGLRKTNGDGYVALNYAEFLESQARLDDAKEKFELAVEKLPLPKYKERAQEGLKRVTSKLGKFIPDEPQLGPPMEHPRSIGLISCTKRKKEYVCTARELYSESEKFRRALAFADRHYESSYVVSARHGLVELTQLLSPYDRSLDEFDNSEKQAWATFIAASLRLELKASKCRVCVHANREYAKHLSAALEHAGFTVKTFDFDADPHVEDLDQR